MRYSLAHIPLSADGHQPVLFGNATRSSAMTFQYSKQCVIALFINDCLTIKHSVLDSTDRCNPLLRSIHSSVIEKLVTSRAVHQYPSSHPTPISQCLPPEVDSPADLENHSALKRRITL